MATLAMSVNSHNGSRYRQLRGKSVSDARKLVDQAAMEDDDCLDATTPWTKSLTTNSLGTRAMTQNVLETSKLPDVDHQFPVPPIPPLPSFQLKEHGVVGRPKAAIMPSHPVFGRPMSPSPLGKRQLIRTASASPVSDRSETIIATEDMTSRPSQSSETKSTEPSEEQVTKKEPEKQSTKSQVTATTAIDDMEGETDIFTPEQKLPELGRLHRLQAMAAQSTTSLSSYSTTTRTPAKSPVLERFGLFYRGRRSQATLSPAPSVITSVDLNTRAQSMEPLLSPTMQLMTPPTSPLTPARSYRDKVSQHGVDYIDYEMRLTEATPEFCNRSLPRRNRPHSHHGYNRYRGYASPGGRTYEAPNQHRCQYPVRVLCPAWPGETHSSLRAPA